VPLRSWFVVVLWTYLTLFLYAVLTRLTNASIERIMQVGEALGNGPSTLTWDDLAQAPLPTPPPSPREKEQSTSDNTDNSDSDVSLSNDSSSEEEEQGEETQEEDEEDPDVGREDCSWRNGHLQPWRSKVIIGPPGRAPGVRGLSRT